MVNGPTGEVALPAAVEDFKLEAGVTLVVEMTMYRNAPVISIQVEITDNGLLGLVVL